jgi:hypothetical protein
MRRSPSRAIHTFTFTVGFVGALALPAAPVLAAPFTAVFNGQGAAQNFGISAASAAAAQTAGIPVVPTSIFSTPGVLDVVSQSDSVHLGQVPNLPFESDATWLVESVFNQSLIGSVYLVFTTTDPGTVDAPTSNIRTRRRTVSMRRGWSLIQT